MKAFLGFVGHSFNGTHEIQQEGYSCNSPWIIRLEHTLQQQPHDSKLYDTSQGGSNERAPDAQVERCGNDGIEEDE